jgi:amino acid transporter
MATAPPPADSFEFDEAHNQKFQATGLWMLIVAWFFVIGGAINIVAGIMTLISPGKEKEGGLPPGLTTLVLGVVLAIIGIWTHNSATAFRRIASTKGQDVMNLMTAVENLRRLYFVWAMLIILYFALILSSLVFFARLAVP